MQLLRHKIAPALALCALGAAVFGFIAWKCWRDPRINFLPPDGRAQWVVFPAPFDPSAHTIARIDTVFRRDFSIESPHHSELWVRAAKQFQVRINGALLILPPGNNWKNVCRADVTRWLRPGNNRIEARVYSDDCPPCLWLLLHGNGVEIRTDSQWTASCAGSDWRTVASAAEPPLAGPGNPAGGSEQPWAALKRVWPSWLCFTVVAFLLYQLCGWWINRNVKAPVELCGPLAIGLLSILAILWLALFANNARMMPFIVGFDAQAHADYIKYVQERHALPLPNEGYEMFQPPLYYTLAAIALACTHLSIANHLGVLLLRFATTLLGITNFILVLLSLRCLFPSKPVKQLVGVLFAAFLPMQLYLSHFVTNETLAATLMTAGLFLALRGPGSDKSRGVEYLLPGLVLGLAMLAKTTAVLLFPAIIVASLVKSTSPRQQLGTRLWKIFLTVGVSLIICGWHYLRIWRQFGQPFVGNWEDTTGFRWWQDPGFRTLPDYVRFGCSWIHPFFSSVCGVADGIYSTLWGDGLLSGTSSLDLRLPWNYNLMAAGYLPAVIATAVIILGFGVAVRASLLQRSTSWIVLLTFCGSVLAGFIFMTVRVPSYAQVKAFYALSLLVPLSCFAAAGWELVTRNKMILQIGLGITLIVLAVNTYFSLWIRPSPAQQVYTGIRLFLENNPEPALAAAENAIESQPREAQVARRISLLLDQLGRSDEALAEAKRAVELAPFDGLCFFQLASALSVRGDLQGAIQQGMMAVESAPQNWIAYQQIATWFLQSDSLEQAYAIARQGLTVDPFSPELHCTLALASAARQDFSTATNHFGYSLLLRKGWVQAQNGLRQSIISLLSVPDRSQQLEQLLYQLPDSPREIDEVAWVLATHPDDTIRNGDEAVRLAEHGCDITNFRDSTLLATLAAAYAEVKKFREAVSTAERALRLSQQSRETDVSDLSEQLLRSFRENRPYRNMPSSF